MSIKVMKTALEALEHCEPCCVENPKGFKLWAKVMPLLREELNSHNLSKEKKDYIKPNLNLRDYFAANAMQGLFASDTRDWNQEGEWYERAQTAYEMADAMMEVRKE